MGADYGQQVALVVIGTCGFFGVCMGLAYAYVWWTTRGK